MLGALVRPQRRALWGALSFVLVAGIALSLSSTASARARRQAQVERDARLLVHGTIVPMLQDRDLEAPVSDTRAQELDDQIRSQIISRGTIDEVTIYSTHGRILYDSNHQVIGTRPPHLTGFLLDVLHDGAKSQVHGDQLITYVPVRLRPGGPGSIIAVAQPLDPLNGRTTAFPLLIAIGLGALSLLIGSLFAKRSQAATSAPSVEHVYELTPKPVASSTAATPSPPGSPSCVHPGFRAVEEARRAAEHRAAELEEDFKNLQRRFNQTLEQLNQAEGRLESDTATPGGELTSLRDELRDIAERLHKAELDNNALRERYALRTKELEEVKNQLEGLRSRASAEAELATRLENAERRAARAERRAWDAQQELQRLWSELESAITRPTFGVTHGRSSPS